MAILFAWLTRYIVDVCFILADRGIAKFAEKNVMKLCRRNVTDLETALKLFEAIADKKKGHGSLQPAYLSKLSLAGSQIELDQR